MTDPNNISGQNEYSDLLYAYCLGCLDKEDLLDLNEYFRSGDEFPWQELGEYQNLVALLPSILNIEAPRSALKDKVARKLYRIKNERRPPKTSENTIQAQEASEVKKNIPTEEKASLSDFFDHSKMPNEMEGFENEGILKNDQSVQDLQLEQSSNLENIPDELPEQIISDNISVDHNNFPKTDKIKTMEIEINEVSARHKVNPDMEGKKPYRLHGMPEPKIGKKGKGGIILIATLFIIALLGILYFYQKISANVDTYKAVIDRLNKQVSNLNEQVSINKEVQKILQMKDAHIVNLYGSSMNKEGSGKIVFSFESSSGFLQLSNVPLLDDEKSFQLWMVTEGKTISLGVFKPSDNIHYFPVSLPVQNYKGETKFFVTEESSIGSVKPSNKVCLTGSLQ